MAKGVLGNDPFRRGAASRTPDPKPAEAAEPPAPAPATRKKGKVARRMDEALAGAAAETEVRQQPRKKKAAPAGAGRKKALAQVQAEVAAKLDAAQEVTRAIQDAAPEAIAEAETPEALDAEQEVAETEPETRRAVQADAQRVEAAVARPPEHTVQDEEAERAPEWSSPRPEHREPSAQSHAPRQTVSSALSLAREVASQTLRSDSVARMAKVADGLFSALMTGIGASGSDRVDPYGKDENLARKLTPISNFFYDTYWRVTVEGAPHVPAGPSLLVANHSGAIPIDGFILHQSLQRERPDLREARWLAEDQIFHAPFLGTLYNRLGAIRASPENAVRLLEEGRPVITFPEGVHGIRKPFQERYQLKRLGRGGFAKLAIRQQVPIVPVAIVGAEESMPLLAKLPGGFLGLPYVPITVPPLPARWLIRFGEPIRVEGISPSASEDLLAVQKLVERTRESIEGMLRALLKERLTVFGG